MGKVQNDVPSCAIQALEGILRRSREVEGLQAEILQAGVEVLEAGHEAVAGNVMVGVAEDLDVGMQGFEGVLGVLWLSALSQACLKIDEHTIEFTESC
jgi:hypothetical protein